MRARRAAARGRCAAPGQRGFTLIELMIAMLIGSLLIGLVFAIYTRMSVAYRTQAVLSDTQQALRTARDVIVADVRQAGFMIPKGFRIANDASGVTRAAVQVDNDIIDDDGPDRIRVFYADASARARVETLGDSAGVTFAEVDDLDEFTTGDLAVITRVLEQPTASPTNATEMAEFEVACVVRVTSTAITPPTLVFGPTDATYNTATNSHCDQLRDGSGAVLPGAMVYRFVGRAYQIVPSATDPELSVLQRSPTGDLEGVADDWQDLAFGFTDLQIATRFYEKDDATDLDGDGDAERDWYSGDGQETNAGVPIQVTISLVARTLRAVDTVATSEQPAFIDEDEPEHNELGDRPALPADGDHLYRYSTSRVDLRNLGVGR